MWWLFVSCRSIPDAPIELDKLGSYLFENFEQEDPLYMEQGVRNLHYWVLENREAINEGYRIENLSEEAVSALNVHDDFGLEDLIGAAVGTDVAYDLEAVLDVILTTDPMEVSPEAYGFFETEWQEDITCFLQKECRSLPFFSNLQNIFPLGIEMTSYVQGKYIWVSIDEGDFVVQRRWLIEGASNRDWLNVEQDYALMVMMPTTQGTLFVDIEWVVTYLGDAPFPEDFALGMAIDAMQNGRETLEEYINSLESN